MQNIGYAGTDGRSLINAFVTSTARSETNPGDYHGVVIRGTSGMIEIAKKYEWPISFIPTKGTRLEDYAEAIIEGFKNGRLDYVVPMPEDLQIEGLVDLLKNYDSQEKTDFSSRVVGLTKDGSFIEGDKIACKKMCRKYDIPTARWSTVDAQNRKKVLELGLNFLDEFGGGVFKYPYSAAGKGSRIFLDAWQLPEVYDRLMADYQGSYEKMFGQDSEWPLLVEERMSGVEISFTIYIDKNGHFQILPTALDYPERFIGPASKDNPITGGMGSVSPHPMETPFLLELVSRTIAYPLIKALKESGNLRPCILYPGCIISLDSLGKPLRARVCEINIREGEPEKQPIALRLRNQGALIKAMLEGNLDEVKPEVRGDQIAISIAMVTGPGGPDGQKGYPWSCTKGEMVQIDFDYFEKKKIRIIPSGMAYLEGEGVFKSDGTRIAYLAAVASVKEKNCGLVAEELRTRLYGAFKDGRIRVIPREKPVGNRLVCREDVGVQYVLAERLFGKDVYKENLI